MRGRLFKPVTLGARVILVRDEQVLLVRHSYMPGWYLPGGGLKRDEAFATAAMREAREEVGAHIRSMRLHGLFLNVSENNVDHVAIYVSSDFHLLPRVSAEIAETRWCLPDDLPAGIARGTAARIREHFAGGGPFHGNW